MSEPKIYPVYKMDQDLEYIKATSKKLEDDKEKLMTKKREWLVDQGFASKVVSKMSDFILNRCFNREVNKASQ